MATVPGTVKNTIFILYAIHFNNGLGCVSFCLVYGGILSNIRRTLGNKPVDYSDVVGA